MIKFIWNDVLQQFSIYTYVFIIMWNEVYEVTELHISLQLLVLNTFFKTCFKMSDYIFSIKGNIYFRLIVLE